VTKTFSPQITGLDCPCPGSDASQATFSVGDHLSGIEAGSISEAPAPRNAGHEGWSAKKLAVMNNSEESMEEFLFEKSWRI
jgi:hypothetical protein